MGTVRMTEDLKIVNLEPNSFSNAAERKLKRIGRYVALTGRGETDDQPWTDALRDARVLWTRLGFKVDAALLSKTPRLLCVVTPTTGLTHIDLDACTHAGVKVLHLTNETGFLDAVTATAELTWLLVLALSRPLIPAVRDVQRGHWDRDRWRGRQLSGRRLGIVGLGRLGRIVAGYGRAFRMDVVHFDTDDRAADDVSKAVSLHELLRTSHVVSIHASLRADNHGMVGGPELRQMRNDAILINTARGELVDERSLLASLESGGIAGAAVDVLADEVAVTAEGIGTHPLVTYARNHENLIVTPHIGGACEDAMEATELHMVAKLLDFLKSSVQD